MGRGMAWVEEVLAWLEGVLAVGRGTASGREKEMIRSAVARGRGALNAVEAGFGGRGGW